MLGGRSICVCDSCGKQFEPTVGQRYNKRSTRSVCSKACMSVLLRKVKTRPPRFQVCPGCGKEFNLGNRYVKPGTLLYCTHACWVDTGGKISREARKAARDARKAAMPPKVLACRNCGKDVVQGHNRKEYCDKFCQREWYAGRFDRWKANPQPVRMDADYDQFLDAKELPCPIEGCDWRGLALTVHANVTHGIVADEFKEMCGFNHTTGVVTTAVSRRMRQGQLDRIERGDHVGLEALIKGQNSQKRRSGAPVRRAEASLHLRKVRALRTETEVRQSQGKRLCKRPECGVEFDITDQYKLPQRFCSKSCQRKHGEARRDPNYMKPRNCKVCGAQFPVNGKQAVCGEACRKAANAKPPLPLIDKTCAWCSTTFQVPDSPRGHARVCCDNPTCKAEHARKAIIEWKRNHRAAKKAAKEASHDLG